MEDRKFEKILKIIVLILVMVMIVLLILIYFQIKNNPCIDVTCEKLREYYLDKCVPLPRWWTS